MSQVLFAIGATIRTDLNGVLRIAALWDGISGNLGLDRMYQGPSVTNAAKVTQVIVTEHQCSNNGINGFVLGNSKFFTRPGKSIEKIAINFAPSKLRFLHLN